MKRVAVALFLLLVFAASGYSQVPDDKLIVAGQRIGKWTLDMTIDDLLRMNGPRRGRDYRALQPLPNIDMVSPDVWEHHWDQLGIYALTVGRDSQEVIVLATEGEYKDAKGIGPGVSSQQGLEAAYGKPTAVTVADGGHPPRFAFTVIYDEIGLAAWVWRPIVRLGAGMITTSLVFRPGAARTIWKF